MSAIADTFERLRARGEMALVAYLTAGYPSVEKSMRDLRTIAESGADLIELGVPFADPVADGPTIQRSSHAALRAGATLRGILGALDCSNLRAPVSVMSYLNPLEAYGREALLGRLARIGVRGLIVPDLPLEESAGWSEEAERHGIDLTLLAAPTSSPERLRSIASRTRGFLYYVSVAGITGVRRELAAGLPQALDRLRSLADKPVAVGFGISTPAQIRQLREHADGVVVGSRIIQAIADDEPIGPLIRGLKDATRTKGD